MRLQLQYFFLLLETLPTLIYAGISISKKGQSQVGYSPIIQKLRISSITSFQARAARSAEYITLPRNIEGIPTKNSKAFELESISNIEKEMEANLKSIDTTHLMYVQNISSTENDQRDRGNDWDIYKFSRTHHSFKKPTTIRPILTTQRDTSIFQSLPVNMNEEDTKEISISVFGNEDVKDRGDINLVPAGSNTIIQVKKGPNGKDYAYEYVYYYYDEEDENKANDVVALKEPNNGMSLSSSDSRRGSVNRKTYNNYNTLSATTATIEPLINEIIQSDMGKARQLLSTYEGIGEKLPTNTRFPPRAHSNHTSTEIPERAGRMRGNRQRMNLDIIDSTNFSSLQDGPEFPHSLPNGPVRFLGVTPNEDNEEKLALQDRGRLQKMHELVSIPKQYVDEIFTKKRAMPDQFDHDADQIGNGEHQIRQDFDLLNGEQFGPHTSLVSFGPHFLNKDKNPYTDVISLADPPITQTSRAMDKVVLDLYAFLQQGRNSLVDCMKNIDSTENIQSNNDFMTTEFPGSFIETSTLPYDGLGELYSDTVTPTTPSTLTFFTPLIHYTTPSTATPVVSAEKLSTAVPKISRSKFKRPDFNGALSRNYFKSQNMANGSTDMTPATLNEVTAGLPNRSRSRFSTSSFIHNRQSSQKMTTKEPTLNTPGRVRYRSTSVRSIPQIRTVLPIAQKFTGPSKVLGLGKMSMPSRGRGARPGTRTAEERAEEQGASMPIPSQEGNLSEQQRMVAKTPNIVGRSKLSAKPVIKSSIMRLSLRHKSGQVNVTRMTESVADDTTVSDVIIDEKTREGNETIKKDIPEEPSGTFRSTTANPLNKLRNKIQIKTKITTAGTLLTPAVRRTHLLARRKSTETPLFPLTNGTDFDSAPLNTTANEGRTESSHFFVENSTGNKREEIRNFTGLLGQKRRILPRRFKQNATSTAVIQ